jgi:hypothetical protein
MVHAFFRNGGSKSNSKKFSSVLEEIFHFQIYNFLQLLIILKIHKENKMLKTYIFGSGCPWCQSIHGTGLPVPGWPGRIFLVGASSLWGKISKNVH